MTEHRLKLSYTDDRRGIWLTSNGRTWFMDRQMLADLILAGTAFLNSPPDIKEWRNYKEEPSRPMPFQPLRSNSLDDLL